MLWGNRRGGRTVTGWAEGQRAAQSVGVTQVAVIQEVACVRKSDPQQERDFS